jgi:hypothetical protein
LWVWGKPVSIKGLAAPVEVDELVGAEKAVVSIAQIRYTAAHVKTTVNVRVQPRRRARQ